MGFHFDILPFASEQSIHPRSENLIYIWDSILFSNISRFMTNIGTL